jgi:cytochrome c biogenesis protein CcmG/thiol:disulfide interchange protein DsbE
MTSPQKSRSGFALWLGIGVVVLVLALVAIIVSQGGDDGDDSSDGSSTTAAVPVELDPGSAPALPVYDPGAEPDPAVGETIPTVTGTDFAGDEITLGPDGTAQVILFVAHWCPHCQKEIPLLQGHLDDNPMPDDVELVTVSTSVQPGAENYPPEAWLEDEGWTAPVLADDEGSTAAQAYGLSSFPYFVVVDADGTVVMRASGELSTDEFDAAVDAARTGQA